MNKRTLKSIIIMGISSVVGYLVTLFLTSYVTDNIGIEAYRFVSISKTFVSYGEIVTIALTSFVVRYITINYHKHDIEAAESYYVSSINASIVLCILLSVVFSILTIKIDCIIKIPQELLHSVRLLFATMFVAFVATTMSTPFSTGFYIKDRLDISGIIKIISYTANMCVLIVLFSIFNPSLWFVGVGSIVAALIILLGSYFSNKKLVPDFRYNMRLHSNQKVKMLLTNGLWNSINQLGNTLNSGLDLLFSNAMLTDIQTGQIAVSKSIGTIFSSLAGIIFQPLQPELLRTYSEGINGKFLNQLKKSMKLCGFFGSLAFSGFFALGFLFYKLWLPSQDYNLLHILTIITVFTYIMDIFLQPIYYVNTLTVKNKIPCFITIIGGLLNVVGMFILIKYTNLGVYAVPITTAVIMFLINFCFNPVYACWCLGIKRTYFYPLIFKHLFATVLMCFVFKVISVLFNPGNWIGLVICAIIMVIIGTVVYFVITFDNEERVAIIKKIKNKIAFLK